MTEIRPGRFQILPPIVKNLIIINGLMVVAQFALGKFGIDLADYLGLHHWRSHFFQPWQFVTHMFMHGSVNDFNGTILHIFSNMFALWMFGSMLENLWGPKRFLTFYIICGLGAALLHLGVVAFGYHQVEQAFMAYQQNPSAENLAIFAKEHLGPSGSYVSNNLNVLYSDWVNNPLGDYAQESITAINQYLHGIVDIKSGAYAEGMYDQATVGASGAVFGILFAFGYLFPNTLLYIYFLVPIKAKYVVAAYALFELFAGFKNSSGDNVAHFAHLGGMLVAFILLRIWNKKNRKHFY